MNAVVKPIPWDPHLSVDKDILNYNAAVGSSSLVVDPLAIKANSSIALEVRNFSIDRQRVSLRIFEKSDARLRQGEWFSCVCDPTASADVDALSKTARSVLETLFKFGPNGVSLEGLQAARVNGEHLTMVLRATFKWRAQIPAWKQSLDIAAIALLREGINPTEALFGLRK